MRRWKCGQGTDSCLCSADNTCCHSYEKKNDGTMHFLFLFLSYRTGLSIRRKTENEFSLSFCLQRIFHSLKHLHVFATASETHCWLVCLWVVTAAEERWFCLLPRAVQAQRPHITFPSRYNNYLNSTWTKTQNAFSEWLLLVRWDGLKLKQCHVK